MIAFELRTLPIEREQERVVDEHGGQEADHEGAVIGPRGPDADGRVSSSCRQWLKFVRERRVLPSRHNLIRLDDRPHLFQKREPPLEVNRLGQNVVEVHVGTVAEYPNLAVWVIVYLRIVASLKCIVVDRQVPELRWNVLHLHAENSPLFVVLVLDRIEPEPFRVRVLAAADRQVGQFDRVGAGPLVPILPQGERYAAEEMFVGREMFVGVPLIRPHGSGRFAHGDNSRPLQSARCNRPRPGGL